MNTIASIITERKEPALPQTTEEPVFYYPQISCLYRYRIEDIEDEKIHELLSLEKELLRKDFETVIYDAIKRFEFFDKKDVEEPLDSCLHALYLLKEIKSTESLPAVLDLLRQPSQLLELWIGDLITDNIWQVLYALGQNQPKLLADFLKEPLNYEFVRIEVSDALVQIALHQPERRGEIIQFYKEVIEYFFSNKDDKTIIDEALIGFIIGDLVDLNAKELLPQIKKLFDEDMVNLSILGDYKDTIELFEENYDAEDEKKELQNYFEIKEEIKFVVEQANEFDFNDENSEWDNAWEDAEIVDETEYFYSSHVPFVRETPKVGRNEPCPCGSGKKYKKCHGKDE